MPGGDYTPYGGFGFQSYNSSIKTVQQNLAFYILVINIRITVVLEK